MIPTTHEEALVDLAAACADGAAGFAACAERAQAPALKAALRARSEQCSRVLALLRAVCSDACAATPARSAELPAPDVRVFAQYETIEGHVLSAFRDAIDQGLPARLSESLVAQFEIALNQYMQLVALRPRLLTLPARTVAGPDATHDTTHDANPTTADAAHDDDKVATDQAPAPLPVAA
jgi:hypothetical protein